MTRINSAINLKNLTDQHLIAELRELPRIFTAVNKRIEKGIGFNDIPKEFCLGRGHTKFFYDKLSFLCERHRLLRFEYRNRFDKFWNFQVDTSYFGKYETLHLLCSHIPSKEEKQLLTDRISTRITESNQIPRYYGEKITKEEAIRILKS